MRLYWPMQMTGWLTGQVFLQTVDDGEVAAVTTWLNSKSIAHQVLTASERMTMDSSDPASAVTANSYSIAIQLSGFPQVIAQVLGDITTRAHGGGWALDAPAS
jgi:hypothetical protein